jgi:hypothetical protein
MADVIDKAVRLYEAGRLKDAARLIAKTRRRAAQDDDTERLAEVESVIGQMQTTSGARIASRSTTC